MSKLFSLNDVKTHSKRNAFDLSFRNCFTSKAGQLLPVLCKEVVPGDHFSISVNSLTRTSPIDTDAYARMKEYFDFFFVPLRLLYRYAPDTLMFSRYTDAIGTPPGANSSSTNTLITNGVLPYVTTNAVASFLQNNKTLSDDLGFSFIEGAGRLLEYLDYGVHSDSTNKGSYANLWFDDVTNLPTSYIKLNPFPLLAYQKIYQDFYRQTQWEKYNALGFNIDWVGNQTVANYSANVSVGLSTEMLKLRYCNWKKDMFMGVMPAPQVGSVSVVPVSAEIQNVYATSVTKNLQFGLDTDYQVEGERAGVNVKVTPSTGNSFTSPVNISVLDIRKAEALQRWKEVTMSNDWRYNAQVKAHFGVNVPDSRAQMAEYLGGFDDPVMINEVVSTAQTDNGDLGQIAGKGIAVNKPNKIDCNFTEHGILMCIYHVLPELDYASCGIDPYCMKVDANDYYIPEYQSLGLGVVKAPWLLLNNSILSALGQSDATDVIGYAPRYIEYKTSVDKVHGDFLATRPTWTIPLQKLQIESMLQAWIDNKSVSSKWFKVNPAVLQTIFGVAPDAYLNTDQFLNNVFFDIKRVVGMDVDGMPY